MNLTDIAILSAVRTPIGAFGGARVEVSAAQLGAVVAQAALERTGLSLPDFDLIELNEAFAAQVLAVERELAWNVERRNVHGGAVAMGHPTGCSGARVVVTLLHALGAHDRTLGLAALCVSGGLGMAVALERA